MKQVLWGKICWVVYVILAVLGFYSCTHGVFLFVVSGGYALVAADKLLIVATYLVAEHRL